MALATPASKVCPWSPLTASTTDASRSIVSSIDRASERFRGESAQKLLGITIASLGIAGHVARKEPRVVRWTGPVAFLERPEDGHGIEP